VGERGDAGGVGGGLSAEKLEMSIRLDEGGGHSVGAGDGCSRHRPGVVMIVRQRGDAI